MDPQDKKIKYIDKYNIIKGIAIFFVISIHVLYKFHGYDKPVLLEVFNYIIGFSVPLFMILGGFFIAPKLEELKSLEHLRIFFVRLGKRILAPYYISLILLVCVRFFFERPVPILPFFLLDANVHGLYFIIIYIYSYAVSGLICCVINNIFENFNKIFIYIIFPLLSLSLMPISKYAIEYFPGNNVMSSLSYVSYFIYGFPVSAFFRKIERENSFSKFKLLFNSSAFIVLFTVCLILSRMFFGNFEIISGAPPNVYRLVYSIYLFISTVILLGEVELFILLGRKLLLNDIGSASLFIFFVHPYFIYILPYIFKFFPKDFVDGSLFIFPWVIATYLITFFSLKLFEILPLRVRLIFSR